ncbi:hypothetical protein BJX99DRAFT_272015 [Aspergillus californicus]
MTPEHQKDIRHPLAIIGFSLKFPGDAVSAESFWETIVQGSCLSRDFPPEKLNIDAHYHPDPNRLHSLSLKGGHFMKEDLSLFDAPFFSITATEAQAMDPQQRLVLEASYRALENAGITMEQAARSNTCVFTGSFTHEYEVATYRDLETMPKFAVTGNSMAMLSNRVSWFFGLNGPSATVDTACSSSLTAVDLVCQSIWAGNSTMGMAIGSNTILSGDTSLVLNNLGLLSPDSRSYAFDQQANGYGRGEGVGVLIIKPVGDAIRDGDTIRAVIRASASNQDGRTPGITAPSGEMQEQLIRETYRKAGLDMADTRYFEAHGTGTAVGDPIECRAIGSVFRRYRSPEHPLYIGSVKSITGHLEGAAGVAGVLKAVLALEKGEIPPAVTPDAIINPRIDEEFLHIKIPSKTVSWPVDGRRRASVSSFGFGGSNCHLVLDDAYHFLRLRGLDGNHNTVTKTEPVYEDHMCIEQRSNRGNDASDRPQLLVWSSQDEKGIDRIKSSWSVFFSKPTPDGKTEYLHDLSHTLGTRRTHFQWRSFAVAKPSHNWSTLPDKITPASRSMASPNLALMFSGQGSQWYAMGRDLLFAYPVFHQSIKSAGEHLLELGCSWSLLDELQLSESESHVNQPEYSQTMTTALQVALVDLLASWNLAPSAVVGHSSGEIAAAYAAGAISQRSTWKIAFFRGKLSGWLEAHSRRRGSMIAVGLGVDAVGPYIARINGQHKDPRLQIACINSTNSVTVSGDELLIDILKENLDEGQVFARKLKVGVAYHSVQMHEIAADYRLALGELDGPSPSAKTRREMVSSVTGTWIEHVELRNPDYWVRNLVSPVLFIDALTTLCEASADPQKNLDRSYLRHMPVHHLLEVGPHSVMQGACTATLRSTSKGRSTAYLSMLVRNVSAVETALTAAGYLYSAGYPLDLSSVNLHHTRKPKHLCQLPEYPFDHTKSYWHESQLSKGRRLRRFGQNDLLGVPDPNWNPLEARWRHHIRLNEMPWVADHKVNGMILYPGMGMLVMAIEAAKQMTQPDRRISGFHISEAVFRAPIRVPSDTHGIETGFYMRPLQGANTKDSGMFTFRLCSYSGQIWTENCTGRIQIAYATEGTASDAEIERELHVDKIKGYTLVQQAAISPVKDGAIYERMAQNGLGYGKAFQLVTGLAWHQQNGNQVIGKVRNVHEHTETIHPTTLDGILQISFWALTECGTNGLPTMVPTQVDKLWVSCNGLSHLPSDALRAYGVLSDDLQLGMSLDVRAFDDELKQTLVDASGLKLQVVSKADRNDDGMAAALEVQACHYLDWKPDLAMLSNNEVSRVCTAGDEAQKGTISYFTEVDFIVTAHLLQNLRRLPTSHAQPHLTEYVNWMWQQTQAFDECRSRFACEPWKSRLYDDDYIHAAEDRVLKANAQGFLTVSVARNLPLLLNGELDPLAWLFEYAKLKDYYIEQVNDSHGVRRLASYLDLLGHQNPQLRIIEIGAGTGSMTKIILQSLGGTDENRNQRRYAQLHYTDISRSFFSEAEAQFSQEGDRIRFSPLDIEQDPADQGFECGTYDVAVASLALHATTNLAGALTNVRKLLKPGGKLILNEITETSVIRTSFVFGLLEGWWLGSEPYRKWGPCVEQGRWHELLQQTGYSGIDLAFPDYEDVRCHETTLLISSAISELVDERLPLGSIEIIYDQGEQEQADFARGLAPHCHQLTKSPVHEVCIDQALENGSTSSCSLRVFLLELLHPMLSDISSERFGKLQGLLCSAADVLWVSSGAGSSTASPHLRLADGLLRALGSEDDRKGSYVVTLEDQYIRHSHQRAQIMKVIERVMTRGKVNVDTEYRELQGLLHIPRLRPSDILSDQLVQRTTQSPLKIQPFKSVTVPLKLDVPSSGLVPGFKFVEDAALSGLLEADEIEVEVKCAGINFRDVLTAIGQLNSPLAGFECSGIVVRTGEACTRFQVGDRVVALHDGCFAHFVRAKETGPVVKLLPSMSFTEAAALPVNFVTAYIALHDVARMRAGESILIHSGAGGTGQATIQLAQALGATVFSTVGSDAKRRFLIDVYNIPEQHIFSSRSTQFRDAVMVRTDGRGVDVVFNSLAGESLRASWECLAPNGRFLEIGNKDILANEGLPMRQFLRNISFHGVNLISLKKDRPDMCAATLSILLTMAEQGKINPAQPIHCYGVSDIEKAMRLMQSGKHIGKVVIEMRDDDAVMTVLNARPTTALDPKATYVVSGGLGGLGRNISLWLVDRGARNLLLLSRSGDRNPQAQEMVKYLARRNVRIFTPSCDISNSDSLRGALEPWQAQGLPPIKGCIQAAMILRDALFEGMTHASWSEALAPKVRGSWNLHQQLPRGMDFFIMCSSISGIFGARGQANYAAGNTFQDALAAHRISLGEKATSFGLGLVGFTGAVFENPELQKYIYTAPITEPDIHALLDVYCSQSCTDWNMPFQPIIRITPLKDKVASGHVPWINKPMFRQLAQEIEWNGINASAAAGREGKEGSVAKLLSQVTAVAEANDVVIQALLSKLSRALSIPLVELDAHKPLSKYGVDSLLAVELRRWFANEVQADIAVFDIVGDATATSVGQLSTSKSRLWLARENAEGKV